MSSTPPGWGQGEGQSWEQPGAAPPPPPPPPMGQTYSAMPPGVGYAGAGPREHPDGTTVLVLGILSLVICGLLGPFAWAKGNKAIREIDANPGAYTNRGSVSAGRICGIIASVLLIIGVAFTVLVVIGAIAAGTST